MVPNGTGSPRSEAGHGQALLDGSLQEAERSAHASRGPLSGCRLATGRAPRTRAGRRCWSGRTRTARAAPRARPGRAARRAAAGAAPAAEATLQCTGRPHGGPSNKRLDKETERGGQIWIGSVQMQV